jgi:predicted NBD/HSP70 family sugar kinase
MALARPTTTPQARHWRSAAAALELMRRRPVLTRRELARELGLASGAASDLLARLRAARLVAERPAPATGAGRPTTVLHAHRRGPLVLALDLRHGDWRLAACGVNGEPRLLAAESHSGEDAQEVVWRLGEIVAREAQRAGRRAVAVGVAVPGLTTGTRLLDAAMLGWCDVELAAIGGGLPVVAGNDATMAAVAEARARPASGALLHLVLEIGIGGALVVGGQPAQGARGLAGEYGHLPFGDPGEVCDCGARGCWGVLFDPRRLAARLGAAEPANPRAWLQELLTAPVPPVAHRRLREELATGLGRGAAGLVNALDPDTVTLGGLAGTLRDAAPEAFEQAFEEGMMAVHRAAAPNVAASAPADDAVLLGVATAAFDAVLDAERLARWAAQAR